MNIPVVSALIAIGIGCALSHDLFHKWRARKFVEKRPERPNDDFAADFFPDERTEIIAKVREIIGCHLSVNILKTLPADKVNDDLCMDDLDSMANVECILELEKEFSIDIKDQEAQELITIEDIIQCVTRKVNERQSNIHGN